MKETNFVEAIGRTWPQVGKTFIIVAVIAVILSLIIIAIIEAVKNALKKEQNKEKSLSRFYERSSIKKLSGKQTELLRAMITNARIPDFDSVIDSITLFEQCVETEIIRMQDEQFSFEDIQSQSDIISRIRLKLGYSNLSIEKSLTSTRQMSTGILLSIRPLNHRNQEILKATVVGISEIRLTVKAQKQDAPPFINKDDNFIALFNRSDAEYSFQTRIIDLETSPTGVLGLQHAKKLQRRQLRNNVRFEIKIPVKYRVIRSMKSSFSTGQQEALTMDISGGGLSFVQNEALLKKDILSINFDLPTGRFRGIGGTVLHITEQYTKDAPLRYKHHIQFTKIDKSESEKIIRYIFEKQREENLWR